jgi:hypothetical protein
MFTKVMFHAWVIVGLIIFIQRILGYIDVEGNS